MNPLNFLGKISGKQETKSTSYLSLALTPDRILALIWNFQDDQVKNLGFGHKSYQNLDVLIHQAAVAIDMAGEQAKVDVTKVVFGLSSDWFDDGNLGKQTTKLLKQMSQELDLDPQAFVPLPSAINHLLKTEEAVTPNSILLGVFAEICEVHLLENNTVTKTNVSKAQINIEKIEKLIEQLKEEKELLPAKIIVYGVSESSPLGEKISKHDWKDNFIHEPKVEFLDDNELVRAVACAQAADILGFEPNGAAAETQNPKQTLPVSNELGFVEGEDILLRQDKQQIEETAPHTYAVEQEIQNLRPVPQNEQFAPDQRAEPETQTQHKRKSINPIAILTNLIPKSGKKIVIAAGILIILLLAASFVAGLTLTKAEVAIKVIPKPQEEDFIVTVQEGGSFDPTRSQLPGSSQTGTADGSQKLVTTGSKKVGESAKGEVTVFNITSTPKTFSKGSELITDSALKYALDDQIEATSASKPGQASQTKVHVTAVGVGPQYNLDLGQQLSFTQFDKYSYWAQNDAPFSGGAERQITVVTQDDMNKLEKSLNDTLFQKARDDLKNKASGTQLQDDAISVKVTKKQFDKKLDEEAALLNLDMQIEAKAITYDENVLKKLLAEIVKKDIDNNLEARPENIEIAGLVTKQDEGKLRLSGKIKAALVPKLNEEDLKAKIAGKSIKDARATILETGQANDVQVNFSPNLPFIFSLPRNKDKITFKIET